jgi:REP element-mobilizing transposase RayT
MARRPRVFAAGVLYHVIARGNQRQKTFTSDSDYPYNFISILL